jgi:type 2A phosphatase activator TIP41
MQCAGISHPERLPGSDDELKVKSWKFHTKNSHILGSKCGNPNKKCDESDEEKCQFCAFHHKIPLPHLPDMVFANNTLRIIHDAGATIEFLTLDALQGVSPDKMDLVVSCAQAWKESRKGCKLLDHGVRNPFDWTFTTRYSGTLHNFDVQETTERIDLEKLCRKERILFYKDLTLFEDELHDNGVAVCNVKLRVMPSSFYVLLRFFLRVDGVLVRMNDTRIYHEFETDYLLREFTSREARLDEINIPSALCIDPNEIMHLLPLVASQYEKLVLPKIEAA